MSYGPTFAAAVDVTGGTLDLPVGARGIENLRLVDLVDSGVVLAEALDLPVTGGFRRGSCWGLLAPSAHRWVVVLMGTSPADLAGDGVEIGRLSDDDAHRWASRFAGRPLRVAIVIEGTPGFDRVDVRFRSDLLARPVVAPPPVAPPPVAPPAGAPATLLPPPAPRTPAPPAPAAAAAAVALPAAGAPQATSDDQPASWPPPVVPARADRGEPVAPPAPVEAEPPVAHGLPDTHQPYGEVEGLETVAAPYVEPTTQDTYTRPEEPASREEPTSLKAPTAPPAPVEAEPPVAHELPAAHQPIDAAVELETVAASAHEPASWPPPTLPVPPVDGEEPTAPPAPVEAEPPAAHGLPDAHQPIGAAVEMEAVTSPYAEPTTDTTSTPVEEPASPEEPLAAETHDEVEGAGSPPSAWEPVGSLPETDVPGPTPEDAADLAAATPWSIDVRDDTVAAAPWTEVAEPVSGLEDGIETGAATEAAIGSVTEREPTDVVAGALGVGAGAESALETVTEPEPTRPPVTEADLEHVPAPPPPPGWYPDPGDARFWRRWDGAQWTDEASVQPPGLAAS